MDEQLILRGDRFGCFALILNNDSDARRFLEKLQNSSPDEFGVLWGKLEFIAEIGPPNNKNIFRPIEREKNLYEIKNKMVRLFCFYDGSSRIVITHAWNKTSKGQDKQIDKAIRLKKQWLAEKRVRGDISND